MENNMSYQQELQNILQRYPEIKQIKVECEQIIGRTPSMPSMPNMVPSLDTGFTITETRLNPIPESSSYNPRPTQKKAEDNAQVKETLNALKIPKV